MFAIYWSHPERPARRWHRDAVVDNAEAAEAERIDFAETFPRFETAIVETRGNAVEMVEGDLRRAFRTVTVFAPCEVSR